MVADLVRKLAVLLVALLPAEVFAQPETSRHAPDPRRHITEYAYDHWGIDDGIPQSTVLSMVQDSTGR